MVEVSLDKIAIPGAPRGTGAPNILKESSGYLGDIIKLVSQGKELLGHVDSIIGTLKGNQTGAGNSNITTSDLPHKSSGSQDAPKNVPSEKPEISDKDMENFVTSPGGIEKIAGAIDKIIPLTGDIKLSELKEALLGSKEEPKKTSAPASKGETKK